jgi:hypothetical protein
MFLGRSLQRTKRVDRNVTRKRQNVKAPNKLQSEFTRTDEILSAILN